MKKQMLSICLACAMIAPVLAEGEKSQVDEVKIGFVNSAQLLKEAPQVKVALKKIEKEFEGRSDEMKKRKAKLEKKFQDFAKEREMLSKEQLELKERELTRLKREFERDETAYFEDLNLRKNEEMGRLQGDILETIATFSVDNGYDLIVSENVVFASKKIDITAKVIEFLKSKK